MGKQQHAWQRRRHKSWKRWTIFIVGVISCTAGTMVLLLSIGNIIPAIWSYILTPAMGLCGLLLGLGAWLFPLSPEQPETMPLPRAAELVRESFRLGDDSAANFPFITQPVRDAYKATEQALLDASRGAAGARSGVVILGEANTGKTRLAFEALTQTLPSWPVLRWRPDYSIDKVPTTALRNQQGLVVFIDDLQDYVSVQTKDTDGSALTADHRITTLHTLLETIRQDMPHPVVVATCRLEDEARVRAGLGQLFTKFGVVALPRFSVDAHDPEASEIIADFQMHGSTHIGDWDGTLGSLVLGLSTKNQEYLKIRATPAATVLRAMKLLTQANILEHTELRLRHVCAAVFGEETLQTNEKTWREAVNQLVQKQFVTEEEDEEIQELLLVIRKDTYFDQVITDYPVSNRPHQLCRDLLRLQQVFVKLKDALALFDLGLALHRLKQYDEALAAYNQVIHLDLTDALVYNRIGNVLGALKRYDEAFAAYDQALRLDPDAAYIYYNKGVTLAILKRYDEALMAYDRVIQIDPNDANVCYNRGIALHYLKRYDEALASYERALSLNTNDADIYNNMGWSLDHLKRYDEALAAYDQAIELDPRSAHAYANRGTTLDNLKRYDEALAAYDQALRLDSRLALVYANKGHTLMCIERYDEALGAFEQALRLDPGYAAAYHNKGVALAELGRYDEALGAYDQSLGLD